MLVNHDSPQDQSPEHQGTAPGQYDLSAVRELLRQAFTADELWRFCQERPPFQRLIDRFGRNASLENMIDDLIEHACTRALMAELLGEVEAYNPGQFARHAGRLRVQDGVQETCRAEAQAGDGLPPRPAGGTQVNVEIGAQAQVSNVMVAGGNIQTQIHTAPPLPHQARRSMLRMLGLLLLVLGLAGGLLWLWKVGLSASLDALLSLAAVTISLILGSAGLLMTDRLLGLFGSQDDRDPRQ